MRSEGGVSSCFPTHDAMKQRHGWGAHILPCLRRETWGTQIVGVPNNGCASLRGRSGWRWELFSI